jgi:hypothetical protein
MLFAVVAALLVAPSSAPSLTPAPRHHHYARAFGLAVAFVAPPLVRAQTSCPPVVTSTRLSWATHAGMATASNNGYECIRSISIATCTAADAACCTDAAQCLETGAPDADFAACPLSRRARPARPRSAGLRSDTIPAVPRSQERLRR